MNKVLSDLPKGQARLRQSAIINAKGSFVSKNGDQGMFNVFRCSLVPFFTSTL